MTTQLYDYAGRPITPPSRPETREIAAVSLTERWSEYPSRGLTPRRLAAILYEADIGYLRLQAELFEEMEEKDPHLMSVMQTRRLAVLGLERQVEAASDSTEDQQIADFCGEVLDGLDFKALCTHLLGAIGHGYAAAEPKWSTDKAQWTIGGFNLVHPKNITFLNSLVPLVVTVDNAAGVEAAPFQLIYHRHLAKSGHDTRNGVLRVCAYMYLFKNYALKDWAAFNEVFGMPLRLGKYEPSATPADREALRQAIGSLGSDAAGIISKSTEIEFVEASKTGTSNPYQLLISLCNREISKAVLGQTLTTDTEGSTGTYAAGKVQNEVRRDLLEADAAALSETIRLQLLRPLVGFNFGWDKAVPEFSLLVKESVDLKADSDWIKNLAEVGAEIPQAWVREHFGYAEPKDGEAILRPPVNITPPRAYDNPPAAVPGQTEVPQIGAPGQIPPSPPLPKGGATPAALRLILSTLKPDGSVDYADNGFKEFGSLPQDRRIIDVHQEQDKLTQEALALSAQVILDALKPVWSFIESGKSLEEIQGGLLAVYPDLRPQEMAALLYQAGMLAWMKGRAGTAQ